MTRLSAGAQSPRHHRWRASPGEKGLNLSWNLESLAQRVLPVRTTASTEARWSGLPSGSSTWPLMVRPAASATSPRSTSRPAAAFAVATVGHWTMHAPALAWKSMHFRGRVPAILVVVALAACSAPRALMEPPGGGEADAEGLLREAEALVSDPERPSNGVVMAAGDSRPPPRSPPVPPRAGAQHAPPRRNKNEPPFEPGSRSPTSANTWDCVSMGCASTILCGPGIRCDLYQCGKGSCPNCPVPNLLSRLWCSYSCSDGTGAAVLHMIGGLQMRFCEIGRKRGTIDDH